MHSLFFFLGSWKGEGAFAKGKKIEATAQFQLTLDSAWIRYEHTDQAPGKYKALSVWGIDANSGILSATVFDNFHGYRKFESGGWSDNRLIITYMSDKDKVIFEHFVYEKLSPDSFKMTFEVSKDAMKWTMVDWLVFKRL